MRIDISSPSAQSLRQHGVSDEAIEKTRIVLFNQQAGDSITLPLPLWGPFIFIKAKHLHFDSPTDGSEPQLEDGPSVALLRHEFCHVDQILKRDTVKYMSRQIWARFKARNLYAKETLEKSPCYHAVEDIRERYHQ